jgi:uncharacterized coiled-coil DUF342 family protein
MAGDLLQGITAHFDKRLSELKADLTDELRQLRSDQSKTNDRVTKQSQSFHEDMTRLGNRLDLVAAHVARVGDDVTEVHEQQAEQSKKLDLLQRRLERDLDRLDDHGRRLEVLEDKTSHLPTRIK